MYLALRVLALAAVVYTGLVVIVYFQQPRLLFLRDMPSREVTRTPADIGLVHETLRIETRDQENLHGWFLPAADNHGSVILFFHGNAGNISHRLDTLRILQALGHAVFIFDYRGYGESSGTPSESGLHEDAQAAWTYLRERGYDASNIILFGRSLGGAVAARLAGEVTPGGLVIESAFTSVPDIASELYPWLPVRWLARMQFDTRSQVAEVDVPVLVVHSRDDEIIPFHHGRRIFEAAHEPKSLLELRGSHNEGFLQSEPQYVRGLEAFLSNALQDQSGQTQSSMGTATSNTSTSMGKPRRQ